MVECIICEKEVNNNAIAVYTNGRVIRAKMSYGRKVYCCNECYNRNKEFLESKTL